MAERLVSLKSPDSGFSTDLLGGKGFNLWKMAQAGIPVPPAFIISTDVCREYMAHPASAEKWVRAAIKEINEGFVAEFGYMPLLSVRSGSKFSMPGMMDTLLNVGITSANTAEWMARVGVACLNNSAERLATMYKKVVKEDLPDKGDDQLFGAIIAVFKSWNNERAKVYRKANGISDDLGTAVTVQAMVFGNFNDKSATGVMFTRDPASGDNEYVGDYLINAQGEDVVDGSHNTLPLGDLKAWNPEVAAELLGIADKLEAMNSDMQDIEFTVQDGKLFILQTRNGKRTAQAAVKVAVDMVSEKMISVATALGRVSAREVMKAARPAIDPAWVKENAADAKGFPASPGVAYGKAVFSAKQAVIEAAKGPVILITKETDPDDIAGMMASAGILTARGGNTSHAAVVARGANKVAVVGCEALTVNSFGDNGVCAGKAINAGTMVALDGASGAVWIGVEPKMVGGSSGAVKDFLALLGDHYGYYEVATKAAEVVNAKRVVLPAYALGVAEFEVEAAKMAQIADDFLIDLREATVDPESAPLSMLWGLPYSDKMDKVMALVGLKLKGVRVIGEGFDAGVALKGAGYTLVPTVSSVTGLAVLDNGSMVIADHGALLKHKQEVVALVAEKGIKSLNCVTEVDSEGLKRGAKFALTPMAAALSLLA